MLSAKAVPPPKGKLGISIQRRNPEALFSLPNDATIKLFGTVLQGSPNPQMSLEIQIYDFTSQWVRVTSTDFPATPLGATRVITAVLTSGTIGNVYGVPVGPYYVRGRMFLSNSVGQKEFFTDAQQFDLV